MSSDAYFICQYLNFVLICLTFVRLRLSEEEYVEFSNAEDKIIGTKAETATIYDVTTGRSVITLHPALSNQYTKNRATFNPTDELVLSGMCFTV